MNRLEITVGKMLLTTGVGKIHAKQLEKTL